MAPSYVQEIDVIKEWLRKEDYLPQNFDDYILRKFIHSCFGSMERTKRCIEKFCLNKCQMPEIYTERDPLTQRMQTAFSITCVAPYYTGTDEFIFYELNDPELENFNFYDVLKLVAILSEHWIITSPVYADGHVIILDIKHFYLKIIPKCNFFVLKQFITYLLEAMPVRFKSLHVFNSPSYYETLYAIVKPILPQQITDNIYFHFSLESLHNAIGKQNIPKELGGDASSMKEIYAKSVMQIETTYRPLFTEENFWRADLKIKSKTNTADNLMSGSFKSLDID